MLCIYARRTLHVLNFVVEKKCPRVLIISSTSATLPGVDLGSPAAKTWAKSLHTQFLPIFAQLEQIFAIFVRTKMANNFASGLQPIHVQRLLLPTHEDPQGRVRNIRSCLLPYTQRRVFRALLAVHNLCYNSGVIILFHARTLYLCVFGVFSMAPNLLESGFGL